MDPSQRAQECPVSLGQRSFKRALKDENESFNRKIGLLSSRNGPSEDVEVPGLLGGGGIAGKLVRPHLR